jgi:hypothetical protein
MHTKLTNHPVEQVIAAIQALDLEPIRLRVMDAELGEGWTREYAESVEGAYRNYLTMLVRHPEDIEDIVVSKNVDEFWHTHILHTMKYTEDCDKVFGKYLHHNPRVGERTPADIEKKAALAQKTQRLYQREFGDRQDYNAAWSGISVKAENAVMCSAAVRAENVAMCSAAVRAENVAMCSAAVRAENVAMCSAAIRAENAAMCSAAIWGKNAAMCSAAIRAENVAMCSAAIRVNSSARAIPTVANGV